MLRWHLQHSSHWPQQSCLRIGLQPILGESIVANEHCVASTIAALTPNDSDAWCKRTLISAVAAESDVGCEIFTAVTDTVSLDIFKEFIVSGYWPLSDHTQERQTLQKVLWFIHTELKWELYRELYRDQYYAEPFTLQGEWDRDRDWDPCICTC